LLEKCTKKGTVRINAHFMALGLHQGISSLFGKSTNG